MLAIAIPILLKLQVPILQKGILLGIFSMGIFIILAAILTKLYSLYPPLLTYAYLNWYAREASVCVYVTNLPSIWTLLLDIFPSLRRWGRTTNNHSSSDRSKPLKPSKGRDHELQQFGKLGTTKAMPANVGATESQEHIVRQPHTHARHPSGFGINKDVTFSVRRDSISDDFPATNNNSLEKGLGKGDTTYGSHSYAV